MTTNRLHCRKLTVVRLGRADLSVIFFAETYVHLVQTAHLFLSKFKVIVRIKFRVQAELHVAQFTVVEYGCIFGHDVLPIRLQSKNNVFFELSHRLDDSRVLDRALQQRQLVQIPRAKTHQVPSVLQSTQHRQLVDFIQQHMGHSPLYS